MGKLNPRNLTAALTAAASVALPALAQDVSGPILLTKVNVCDGVNEGLIKNANVVVTGNKITAVSTKPLAVAGGTVIAGDGRTRMPGLIETHQHLNQGGLSLADQFANLYRRELTQEVAIPRSWHLPAFLPRLSAWGGSLVGLDALPPPRRLLPLAREVDSKP